ncbi:ADP-ribose pyrophosphatase [Thalassotalea agarivorans]|uniref:ADP-ribose pyrophosphatase n=2 Tax=Thalassotalea agarivorans TaxID=349064 RepID=A0A1I0HTM0_THASX|nr:ADP-ribose pyrophosphatase [Thalassotalea agarivorans]
MLKPTFTKLDATVHAKKTYYKGFFKIECYQISHALFNGGSTEVFSREVFERGDAVVVLPYDPIEDMVVLQEQFRAGALKDANSPWMLECVAGMYDTGESPADVAIREAKEEANLDIKPTDLREVFTYYTSPGGTSERITMFVARVDSKNVCGVFGVEYEHEDIKVHKVSREHALSMVEKGEIVNASTIIALQWLALHYNTITHD